MNRYAYLTTGFAIKTLSRLTRARIRIHGEENIPKHPVIFVINHFTRVETLLMPYHIYQLTKSPVWSLADYSLFRGALKTFFDQVGVVSTKDPDRDLLIVKSLLSGEAMWIIFPEGRMVKNKKIIEKGRHMISYAGGKHPPHTGAATLALRTEFYRQRLKILTEKAPELADRLMEMFQLKAAAPVFEKSTYIVPVNVTYYPIRAKENLLSSLANQYVENLPERALEELMTEGTILLEGADIDIRFGGAIRAADYLKPGSIRKDMAALTPFGFDDALPSRPAMRKMALRIMERYMASIYGMTTVNHDHLFASLLKLYPMKKMKVGDLKRRAFLAASRYLPASEIYHHDLLAKDQTHLLTDDRYGHFRDFIRLAEEKEIIRREGDEIVKDMSKFSSPFDFHHVRVDNPISVISNEVEPLTRLQRRLRRLAWLPGFLIRRKVAAWLMKTAADAYKEDRKTYWKEGETKKRAVGMPFLIRGGGRKIGVVLIHGYMAAPLEVQKLAFHLGSRGIWVYVPRLRGHGTSPDDLARTRYQDWVDSVDLGYGVISNICKKVVAGGFSTGGALALDLAARVKDVAGVFAISPPVKLQDLSTRLVPAVDTWNRLMDLVRFEGAKKTFVENRPENPHINYTRNPISGVRELEQLMDAVEERLPEITVPALIAQSRLDPVVDHRGAKRVFELLGSIDKQLIMFNFDRHGILLGEGAQRVHQAVGDFVGYLK